jgi:hypothetical protein
MPAERYTPRLEQNLHIAVDTWILWTLHDHCQPPIVHFDLKPSTSKHPYCRRHEFLNGGLWHIKIFFEN